MANSIFDYVKSFEVEDEVSEPNLIVVHIQARDFLRFSNTHQYDEKAVNLMNSCATAILEEYQDVRFGYGFSDEYSFVLARESKFYKRRASKLLSVIVSFFTSVFVTRWKDYFPEKNMLSPPSFQSRIIACESTDVLQAYLAWRQNECHAKFGLKCKELSDMFLHGSCVLTTKVEVKYTHDGIPVNRVRRKVKAVQSGNIASKTFWNEHLLLVEEVGSFQKEIDEVKPEYIESFLSDEELMNWIVVRIDGCHFSKFTEVHEYEKPNDEKGANLMNSCAVAVLNEFQDITFSYGFSDEYSFVFKKDSQLYQRRSSVIVSAIVSFFSSVFVKNWEIFFPDKELKFTPSFDGRAVCYESEKMVRDYLAWRQVDCHKNNATNTCFWMLVNSGKSKRAATKYMEGIRTKQKKELLQQFGIEYDKLPKMFLNGSSIYWDMVQEGEMVAEDNCRKNLVIEHCNIIKQDFWCAHPQFPSA